jgi:hypothetical protein
MKKPSPNPPDTDPAPLHGSVANTSNEAAEQAVDFHVPSIADIKATPRTPSTLFTVNPEATTETLVVYLVETLASVDAKRRLIYFRQKAINRSVTFSCHLFLNRSVTFSSQSLFQLCNPSVRVKGLVVSTITIPIPIMPLIIITTIVSIMPMIIMTPFVATILVAPIMPVSTITVMPAAD